MLSSLVSSNANSQGANSRNSSATAASVFPASVDATEQSANAADVSLDGRAAQNTSTIAQELTGDLFADQLNDALVDTVQLSTEISTPEMLEEQATASAQTPAEPNAEEWLLAMLDQQQLQLHARDTAVPITPVSTSVMAVAALSVNAQGNNATQHAAVNAPENIAGSNNIVPRAVGNVASKNQEIIAAANTTVDDRAGELLAKGAVNGAAASAVVTHAPSADFRSADSMASTNTSAVVGASLTSISPATAGLGDSSINNTIVPTALNPASDNGVQRSVQSQLTLHAPEAKWGEQLLHALRDNVQVQIQQKIQNATIRLDPPELGSLEIYLSHESGRLTVNITASQADVARLIQSTSDRLRQELAGPQFTHVSVQTSADGQNGQQQSRERQRSFVDEQILANDQPFTSHHQQTNHSGDVLVTV